jgi:thiol-disulfide isomerase/thioredoxin
MNDADESKSSGSSFSGLFLLVAIIGTLAVIYALRAGGGVLRSGPPVGSKLMAVNLQPLTGDGRPVREGDLPGKVTLMNFWGTWCAPCRVEFPHLVELQKTLADQQDFQLLAVSCGSMTEEYGVLREETQEFLDSQNAAIPTYYDPGGQTRRAVQIASGDDQFVYPTTLIIDRQGIIRGCWQGYDSGRELEMLRLAEKLLATPTDK